MAANPGQQGQHVLLAGFGADGPNDPEGILLVAVIANKMPITADGGGFFDHPAIITVFIPLLLEVDELLTARHATGAVALVARSRPRP